MNDEVRGQIDALLKDKDLTRADLARLTKLHPNAITRALNNTGGRGGNIPPVWEAILSALDVRLTLTPGAASGQRVEASKGRPGRKPGEEKTSGHTPEALAPAAAGQEDPAGPQPGGQVEEIDAAPLFDEAGRPAVGTPDPGRLAFVPGVLAPKGLSGTARRVLEAVAAGGKLARVGDRWQLNEDGQARSVDPRTVARLLSAGVLAHVEGEG